MTFDSLKQHDNIYFLQVFIVTMILLIDSKRDHLYNLIFQKKILRFFTRHQKHDFLLIFGPLTQKLRLKQKKVIEMTPP